MENDLQNRITKTIEGANAIRPISPKPFFYTRLMAKMESRLTPSVIKLIPAYLRTICVLILMINAMFFFTSWRNQEENTNNELASFYKFNSASVYSN